MIDINASEEQKKLFDEFPSISTQEWEQMIYKDLKGADYVRRLIWKTIEGFDVRPYYRAEDLEKINYLNIFPGDFPFVRSGRKKENNWLIRQDISVKNIKDANKKALDILMKGVDSVGWMLEQEKEPSIEEIEKLMENIYAQSVEVNFICGKHAPKVLDIYIELVKKYNRDLQKINGSVNFDPISKLLRTGAFYQSENDDFASCSDIIKASHYLPHFRVLSVDAVLFKNAGSSTVEELAFGLAYGNEYLQRITDLGVSIDNVAPKIKFNFGVGSNYFMEIAKIRAARLLWAKIVNAYGPSDAELTRTYIHTITSDWNKTIYDPYVNMLRTTTEAMSAIIGGTNSLFIKPFDSTFAEQNDFSERIARNQQLLLKEESYLDKIIDPAAGSYYIETLTDSIVENAWNLFLEIMERGGFVASLKDGFIQERISQTAQKRNLAIANRKEIFVGTNQYPNFSEHLDPEIITEILKNKEEDSGKKTIEPLKIYRGSEEFEKLRAATDRWALSHKRPTAFMLTYGNLAMRRARSQFSANFFGCAGYKIIDNNGFDTIQQGVDAALKSDAEIIVICSADEDYPVIAPEILDKTKHKAIVVVAGYPKDSIEELKSKGLKHFIHIKSNVLDTLLEYNKMLGINS